MDFSDYDNEDVKFEVWNSSHNAADAARRACPMTGITSGSMRAWTNWSARRPEAFRQVRQQGSQAQELRQPGGAHGQGHQQRSGRRRGR